MGSLEYSCKAFLMRSLNTYKAGLAFIILDMACWMRGFIPGIQLPNALGKERGRGGEEREGGEEKGGEGGREGEEREGGEGRREERGRGGERREGGEVSNVVGMTWRVDEVM